MDREQLAMENIGLLYHYYKQYNVTDEDLKQDLALAYWRAMRGYDEDNEAMLSTYVYKVLNMEMCVHIRYNNAKKRNLAEGIAKYSLDGYASDDAKETFGAVVGYMDKNIEQIECDDVVERLMDCLPTNQAPIVALTYQGYRGSEIGKITGTTRQNVNSILHKAQKRVRALLWEEMMA